MKQQFWIKHGGRGREFSGPFESHGAAEAALRGHMAAGGAGVIVERWRGKCPKCGEMQTWTPGRQECYCGHVVEIEATF